MLHCRPGHSNHQTGIALDIDTCVRRLKHTCVAKEMWSKPTRARSRWMLRGENSQRQCTLRNSILCKALYTLNINVHILEFILTLWRHSQRCRNRVSHRRSSLHCPQDSSTCATSRNRRGSARRCSRRLSLFVCIPRCGYF